jgi:hypothetical protein
LTILRMRNLPASTVKFFYKEIDATFWISNCVFPIVLYWKRSDGTGCWHIKFFLEYLICFWWRVNGVSFANPCDVLNTAFFTEWTLFISLLFGRVNKHVTRSQWKKNRHRKVPRNKLPRSKLPRNIISRRIINLKHMHSLLTWQSTSL